jgi:hypothetical protein
MCKTSPCIQQVRGLMSDNRNTEGKISYNRHQITGRWKKNYVADDIIIYTLYNVFVDLFE